MSVSAVALFGSRARGNATPASDVDILLITRERRLRHVTMGNISLFLYPWLHLKRRACAGDLFISHITLESRPLYDPKNRIGALREAFQFKASYADEIRKAADLGWFLMHSHAALPGPLVAKRIAWCVRTILIARSAERRAPLFAAKDLAAFSGFPAVEMLIEHKNACQADEGTFSAFAAFLGGFAPPPRFSAETEDFRAFFHRTRNKVALQTLQLSEPSTYGT